MTVLRRLEAVLEPKKTAVIEMKAALDQAKITNQDAGASAGRGSGLLQHLPLYAARPARPGEPTAAQGRFRGLSGRLLSERAGDLIQYTLAIDRSDEQVAQLYNPLHPAVLRLIQFAVEAAMRRGMPISVCGEMAGEPRFCALLLGLGLRNLSMAPRNIPRVKQRIRGLDMVAATRRARAIMDQSDTGRIAALLDDFNAVALPH